MIKPSALTHRARALLIKWLLVGAALGLAIASTATWWLPRRYPAQVQLQVTQPEIEHEFSRDEPRYPPSLTSYNAQSQIIMRKETIDPVIKELQLTKRWQLPDIEARNALIKNLKVKVRRATDLIEIKYYGRDPHEAADIANLVAKSYQIRRAELELALDSRKFGQLAAVEMTQIQRVADSHQQMIALRKKYKIVDLGAGNSKPDWATITLSGTPARQLQNAEVGSIARRKHYSHYVEAKRQYETQELILLDMREGLEAERIILLEPQKSVSIFEAAQVAHEPAGPGSPLMLLLGLGLGLIVIGLPAGAVMVYARHSPQEEL